MKINKIISFILMSIILVFSFCPLAFASENDNLIDPNMANWLVAGDTGLFEYVDYVGGSENINRIHFNGSPSGQLDSFFLYDVSNNLINGKNYTLNFDASTYGMERVGVFVSLVINYSDGSDDTFWLVEFGDSSTSPNYINYNVNFTPNIQNKGYECLLSFWFLTTEGTVYENACCNIKNLSLTEIESQEGNILKRIYNFIINLPSTFQNFFTDLKNGISGFFTDLKTNLSTWFDNLRTSIGDFFDNLSDNLSGFFTKLKNWLLWFNAEGSGSYVNPFNEVDDDIEDDLESNIVKLANYINDNTQSVSDSLNSVGSVFLVFDAFVVGIPLVLSLIIFAFFIHILKRLLGF